MSSEFEQNNAAHNEKWFQDRAENIQIGDIIQLVSGNEFFVTNVVKGLSGEYFINGFRGDKAQRLPTLSPTFMVYVRKPDHYRAMCPDTLLPDHLWFAANVNDLLECTVSSPGFTKGRFYVVIEDSALYDKWVHDDNNKERTLLNMRADHFVVIP